MLRYCAGCGKIHGGKCPERTAKKYSAARDSQAYKFRSTRVWKRKSAEIMQRDLHCCRVCLLSGIINNRRLSVHHIIPLERDFSQRLENDNLVTLCRFCHEQAERGAIAAAVLRNLAISPPALGGNKSDLTDIHAG